MYLEHFKLKELPFRLSPDPAFLYPSQIHSRAKAYMESTIWFTDGFVVITGEIGAGKTTLIETFLRELEKDIVVAQINQTQVSAIEFLQAVLVQFGFTPFRMKKAELLATLNTFLIEQYAAGRKVLLIVDEAQNLPLRTLEEIRMLSGVETTREKVLRIVLPDSQTSTTSSIHRNWCNWRSAVPAVSPHRPVAEDQLHRAPAGSGRLRRPEDFR
jgi:type II secretory pathway predicted ATPase ExeA